MENVFINIGLIVTYSLLGIALLTLVGFSIKFLLVNIKKSKSTLFGVIGLIVVFILSYLMSSSTDVSQVVFEKTGTDYGLSKLIGSGLILTYVMFILVILTAAYAAISKMIK